MAECTSDPWPQHIERVANALIEPDIGRSVASAVAVPFGPNDFQKVFQNRKRTRYKELILPAGVSPLDAGSIWHRAIALIIGTARPFPLTAVRRELTETSASGSDVFLLTSSLIFGCQVDHALIESVSTDISVSAAKLRLDDMLDLLRLAHARAAGRGVIDAIAAGLTFHSDEINGNATMKIAVASTLVIVDANASSKFVEMAYNVIDPSLIETVFPHTPGDAEFEFAEMMLRCLDAYVALFPARRSEAQVRRRLILERRPANLRNVLEC